MKAYEILKTDLAKKQKNNRKDYTNAKKEAAILKKNDIFAAIYKQWTEKI
jgi:hypothetical protein